VQDPTRPLDHAMTAQFERIIRRVKYSMNYRGSYSTRDILGSLVARWLTSGEWQRLRTLPPSDRRIGESVRRFILDRFEQLRGRGDRVDITDTDVVIPDEAALLETIELAELRTWLEARIAELATGTCDPRMQVPLANPHEVGAVLRLHIDGLTQRQIAERLDISLGLVNKRIVEGTNYLIVLQSIEEGLTT
jgi:hypothetical protein